MELVDSRSSGRGGFCLRSVPGKIYDAVYRQRVAGLDAISNLPKPLRARLAEEFPLGLLEIARRYNSTDGTVRYLLKLADGKTVETVWMPESKSRKLTS